MTEHRIELAAITHVHGTNLYAGKTEADLLAKLAEYCHDNAELEGVTLTADMNDRAVVDTYFEAVSHECLDRGYELLTF